MFSSFLSLCILRSSLHDRSNMWYFILFSHWYWNDYSLISESALSLVGGRNSETVLRIVVLTKYFQVIGYTQVRRFSLFNPREVLFVSFFVRVLRQVISTDESVCFPCAQASWDLEWRTSAAVWATEFTASSWSPLLSRLRHLKHKYIANFMTREGRLYREKVQRSTGNCIELTWWIHTKFERAYNHQTHKVQQRSQIEPAFFPPNHNDGHLAQFRGNTASKSHHAHGFSTTRYSLSSHNFSIYYCWNDGCRCFAVLHWSQVYQPFDRWWHGMSSITYD